MLSNLFSNPGFMPHIHCYLNRPSLVWTMFISDMMIGISYVGISLTLWALVKKIKIPFNFVVICFGVFILACGLTHFMEVWTLQHADYWAAAAIKVVTALASLGTGIYLIKLREPILTVAEAAKIAESRRIELEELTRTLESRVRERTDSYLAEIEKNALLLKHMPNPFFSINSDWKVTYINPAAEAVIGIQSDKIVNRSLWELFPGLKGSNFENAYRRAIREGQRVTLEDYYPDLNRWYEVWAYPFDNGLAISFFDVTERKLSELRFRAEKEKFEAIFYNSAAPLVFFRGPDLVYELVNEAYAALVPGRELLEKPLLEALPELEGTRFPTIIRDCYETGKTALIQDELARLTNNKTGQVEDRYFDTGISRINDGEGKPYGVFVHVTEVTDRVMAKRKIEQALSARDSFLSIASHELKTPITGMKLQAQMMIRAIAKNDPRVFTPERVSRLVESTDEGLSRMSRLVEDMLDISRIQEGKLTIERENIEFVAFLKSVSDKFSDELSTAKMPVEISALPKEILVSADRFRLEQVLTNLITNALRYAPGSPIEISVVGTDSELKMTFQDHGPGIAPENREKIFERFERLVSPNEISGLGLGLYIARQIVEMHGGSLGVEPSEISGAKFVMRLPRTGSNA